MAQLTDTQLRKLYVKGDIEYRANGLYVINDTTYISLWAYKKRRGDQRPTDNNADHGRRLTRLGVPAIACKPDYGDYAQILCYNKALLDELKFI